MMAKKRVAILFGGQSSEHEISCISAGGVLGAIDRERFEPILIGITRSGKWVLVDQETTLAIKDGELPEVDESLPPINADIHGFMVNGAPLNIDLLFPLLHGPYGEDGTVQGLCEMAGIRYVGSGVLASAVAMDKSFAKPIFEAHGLKVAPGVVLKKGEWSASQIENLKYPVFVKPARSGSSRGTTKVKSFAELQAAIDHGFEFDTKVMIEEAIVGREIECGVLESSGTAHASPIGEIKILGNHEFYDFEAKYLDNATTVAFPDDLPAGVEKAIQEAAIMAFKALDCEGLARVDFFYTDGGEIVINELNTMPGFTPTSMFPKLWERGGLSYSEVITKLIDAGLTRSGHVTR
jgi:D-alanine-D-alanine ligase